MSLRIRIEHGQDAGKTWRLGKPGSYLLGRQPDVSIRVLDMKVSKAHARVDVSAGDGPSRLTDLDSRHGTEINGQPLHGSKDLHPGDELRLGLSILRVLSDGEADADARPTADSGGSAAPAEGARAKAAQGAGAKTAKGNGGAATQDAAAGTPKKRRRVLPPDGLVNKEIGGYKVIEKIGQGGMGSVYVAEQLSLHRQVALKVLSEQFTSDRAFVDQFVNEARSAAALNHPNVVQVYDVGREDGRYYFSMEFVPGGSLEERLSEDGKANWQDALNWMMDTANALIFANKRDILHRDVKPDNLMLAEDGSAKLCDLGLAKKAANDDLLAAGIIGTPAFISPEAIRRRKDIDGRSDLYSMGCTFYRLMTGQNPYPGKTVKDILVGHLRSPIPRVSQKVPDIPRELDDAIHKLMAKEVDARYESAEDLLQTLDRVRIQHGLEAHGLRPPSRKPLIIALVVLLLGLAGAVWALSRPKDPVQTGPTAEEIANTQKLEAELRAQKFLVFSADKQVVLGELEGNLTQKPLGIGNWQDPRWERYAGQFDAFAAELAGDEMYAEEPEIIALARKAKDEAKELRDAVQSRKNSAATIDAAVRSNLDALEGELAGLKKAFDAALAENDWLKAAEAVNEQAIEEVFTPYHEREIQEILPADIPAADRRRFKGELLLDLERDIQPLLEQHLPGTPTGASLRQRLLEAADASRVQALQPAKAEFEKGTHQGLEEAQRLLETWLDALPAGTDLGEGALATRIAMWRNEAEHLAREAERANATLYIEDYAHDRKAWLDLVRMVRKPGGLLPSFRFEPAWKRAANDAKAMRAPQYATLAHMLEGDARALGGLFDKLVKSYPDGWSSQKIAMVDEKERPDSVKVKGITPQGIDLGDGTVSWARLGTAWVLDKLLFPAGEDAPRITLDGEDHRAVAVLGEMAGDYDRAQKAYLTYLRGLDPEDQAATRRRVGTLGLERRAGEAWRSAVKAASEVREFLSTHHPDTIGTEKFWEKDEIREEILAKQSEQRRLLTVARAAESELKDPALARTIWATVLRSTPDLATRFAGEPDIVVPPAIPFTPPVKEGADKPGTHQPAEGKPDEDEPAEDEPANGEPEAPPGSEDEPPEEDTPEEDAPEDAPEDPPPAPGD